jgi:hypothetical protein
MQQKPKEKKPSADELEKLYRFDVDREKYGPACGMRRRERWDRAELFGLCPPREIDELMKKYPAEAEVRVKS